MGNCCCSDVPKIRGETVKEVMTRGKILKEVILLDTYYSLQRNLIASSTTFLTFLWRPDGETKTAG